MASEKKITMREYNGTDYDTLYPKTIAEQVDGIYSNDEVLSNSTKALYGLTDSAVPDNVLALLSRFQSGLGNEYLWEKSKSHDEYKYAVVNTAYNAFTGATNQGYTTYIPYGDGFTVNSNGKFELTNRQELVFTYNGTNESELNFLSGKYFFQGTRNSGILSSTEIINCPIGSTVITEYEQFKMQNCDRYANGKLVTVKTIYGYLNSPNPNAYPPSVSDGYTYTPLGQMGAKVQIATGGYMGTDTYGSSNQNSLTFDFEPKLIFVQQEGQGSNRIIALNDCKNVTMNETSSNTVILSWKEQTVAWYSSDGSGNQLNSVGTYYSYLAIG